MLKISKLKRIKPRIPKWRSLHFHICMHITIVIIFVIYVNKMPANNNDNNNKKNNSEVTMFRFGYV